MRVGVPAAAGAELRAPAPRVGRFEPVDPARPGALAAPELLGGATRAIVPESARRDPGVTGAADTDRLAGMRGAGGIFPGAIAGPADSARPVEGQTRTQGS